MAADQAAVSLWRSLQIQGRVLWALTMREVMTRYGRHNIGFLWLFAEPMLFTLGVTALWTATKATHGSDLPIVAFALTGYSAVLLWRNMPSRAIGALNPNLPLLYHRNVRPLDIYLSRLVLEIAGATMSFTLLGSICIFAGWMDPPEDVLRVAGGWLMLAWFGSSLALFLGALSEQTEIVEKLWHPMAYFLFPLSGAAFVLSVIPPGPREVLLWLPMVHGVEFLREGWFGSRMVAYYDMGYMALINIFLTLLGLAKVAKVSRTVIPA